jgi:hypothetical protein
MEIQAAPIGSLLLLAGVWAARHKGRGRGRARPSPAPFGRRGGVGGYWAARSWAARETSPCLMSCCSGCEPT